MAEMILIGCKLPHGLYLDLRDKQNNIVERAKLAGVAGFTLPNPDRKFQNPKTTHGDTFNMVPKTLWTEWLKRNADHPALKSGAIYAAAKKEDAVSQAREHEKENVGFDKVDPKKFGVAKLDDRPKPEGA